MATNTPLQSIVLTSTASSVTFSGISQDYTDLVLVSSSWTGSADIDIFVQFNSDTTSNYSVTRLFGNGSAAASNRQTSQTGIKIAPSNSTTPSANTTHIINYGNTTTYKTVLSRGNVSDLTSNAYVGLWRKTPEAITSIKVYPETGSFSAGSTFDLYGIKSGAPKMMGGDVVTTDGTYWYHTFKTTGALTALVQQPITADILVVAGGGGGGNGLAGGGGGGGFRTATAQSLTAISYSITVGAGGATNTAAVTSGYSGSNSSIIGTGFTTYSATGGGGGGRIDVNGLSGGSGGGGGGSQGSGTTGGAGNAGSYSPVEGYTGGNGVNGGSPYHISGGGGGAGAVGGNATSSVGGSGGNGASSSLSGSSVTYAGGGGGAGRKANGRAGGAGGTGGGGSGAGSTLTSATAGTANTGGGGGGGDWSEGSSDPTGAAGGSGIVIVRYAV